MFDFFILADRDQLQLGTLSHVINSKALGYQELPDFPESLPDPNVRNVEVSSPWTETYKKKPGEKKKKSFYSESESSSGIVCCKLCCQFRTASMRCASTGRFLSRFDNFNLLHITALDRCSVLYICTR